MSDAAVGRSASLARPRPEASVRRPPARARPTQLGTRYLTLLSVTAVIVGLFFKSELITPTQVWEGTAVLTLVATLGLLFLHRRNGTPSWASPDHYITPGLAIVGAGAFSILAPDWRLHALAMSGMGVIVYSSSYVDLCRGIGRVRPLHRFLRDSTTFVTLLSLLFLVLQSELVNILKFTWIFGATLLAGYRSFRFATSREGRAMLSAFLTASFVTGLAFGMVTYLNQGSAYVAVVLSFAWYAYQGFIVHALDDSLTRRIVFEYGLFGVICVYLVALALLTR